MAGFLYKGILLQQHKEPALSRDLREFFNADTVAIQMERPPVTHPDELTPLEIIEVAHDAHIVDERDGESLASKLELCRTHPMKLVVGDAIDDEPYISSQLNPLLKNQKLAAVGLELAKRAAGAEDAHFAVYKNLTDLDVKIPKTIGGYPVKRIRGRYPAEYQASKSYASGNSTLVVGAGALLHLARAVVFNKPQSTAFITVAGNCVGNPTNLEASLGMTVAQVLERCGLVQDPARVIIGGSMTGISVIDTEQTRINATTRAVLAFREEEKDLNFNCIGCSRCVHVCPEGLNPFYLYRSVKRQRYDEFRVLDAQMCSGCGTCSYMCPAKLDLSETIRAGAAQFRPMIASMRAASVVAAKQDTADFDAYMLRYRADKAARAAVRAEYKRRFDEKVRIVCEKIAAVIAVVREKTAVAIADAREKAEIRAAERAVRAAEKAVIDEANAKAKAEADAIKAAEKAVADAARDKAKAEADAIMAAEKAVTDAARAKAKAEAEVVRAAAKRKADEIKTAAKAASDAARIIAKAEAEAVRTKAKVDADIAREKAKAEAQAARAAEAEAWAIEAAAKAEARALIEAAETAEAAARVKAELDGVEFDENWFPAEETDEEERASGSFAAPDFVASGRVAPEELPEESFVETDLPDEYDDAQHGWNRSPREPEMTGGRTK